MFRITSTTTQNRTPQLPHASRNTNPHMFKSSGVIHTTSVSRPQLKCYQVKDKDELHQFDRLKVWELVDKPFGKMIIKLKWLWKNKKDEDQTIIRNKARLVAKGYAREEVLILKNSFAQLLSVGSSSDLRCHEHNKSFPNLSDGHHPEKVYLLRKALYGFKEAPRAWYDELSTFLMSKGFTKDFSDADHADALILGKALLVGYSHLVISSVSGCQETKLTLQVSSAEAEYVALSASCAQVMWMMTQIKIMASIYNNNTVCIATLSQP
ncbi:retrovirus-related pol polyprotein from transposon TNT 1-94 [Tanacetum coccineum]